MEVDLIILPKESDPQVIKLGMQRQIKSIFNKLYNKVDDNCIMFEINGEVVEITYQFSAKTTNMLFVKFTCNYTPMKAAKIIDAAVNLLVRGEHRKSWNIVISYDEVSQLYCCKLMPLFGKFERRTRELVYLTIIKMFGVEWYEKSFSQNLKNNMLSKGKGNKTKLVEGALNELTYEQLKEYLFEPFSNKSMSTVLDGELSNEKIDAMSKTELVSILENCRSVSLWERFFSEYKQFGDFRKRIEDLQPYRNSVMHHKRITLEEYGRVQKELNLVNKFLEEAILLLKDEMYTETKLGNVVSALGNMLSNALGASVSNWVDNMSSSLASLASFGKLAITSAMPQINILNTMPTLNLGAEMTQHFHEVYQVPEGMLQAMTQMAEVQNTIRNSIPDLSHLNYVNSIINSPGMQEMHEIAEQANKMREMIDVSQMGAIAPLINELNSPDMIAARQIAEQNNSLAQHIPHLPFENIESRREIKSEQDDEDKTDKEEDDDQEINSSSN